MVYVALLRGINVGGRNKVDMKALKRTFERVGMNDVETYLNTGNVIFAHDTDSAPALTNTLEQAIEEDFALQLKVLVRSLDDMKRVVEALPASWKNDQEMKSDVLLLWEEIDHESVMDKLVIRPEIDTVHYVPGAVLWSIDRTDATKTGLVKLAGTNLYKQMTVRNVNTTRKIYEMMQQYA